MCELTACILLRVGGCIQARNIHRHAALCVCIGVCVWVLGGAGVCLCVWSEKGGPTGILRPDQTAHACNMSQYPPVYHKFYGAARHVTRRKTLLHSSLLSLSSPCGPSLAHLSAKTNFDSSRVQVSAAILRTSCLLLTLKWLLYGNAPSPPASKLIISIRKTGWRRLSLSHSRALMCPTDCDWIFWNWWTVRVLVGVRAQFKNVSMASLLPRIL